MKLSISTLFFVLCLAPAFSEYPRMNIRGPREPPRGPPPHPQFMKKWQQQQQLLQQQLPKRSPVHSRPIPLHMPPINNKLTNRSPVMTAPLRTFWKSTPAPPLRIQLPEQAFGPPIPEKPFLSSPSIKAQEYDLHVQANSIPNYVNPIKQIGEKGPIHTIPAPNLSPADRPNRIEHEFYKQQQLQQLQQQQQQQQQSQQLLLQQAQPQQTSYVHIQKAHQYQVTEAPELTQKHKIFRAQSQQTYFDKLPQTEAILGSANQLTVNPKELYQYVSVYPQQPQQQQQQQQQLVEAYVPLLQQQASQLQPHYVQAVLTPTQQTYYGTIEPQHEFQLQTQIASDKISSQPELHSFNSYEDPGVIRKNLAPFNTVAKYEVVQPEIETRTPLGSLAQSQYVQSYFDTRDESNSGNNVEPDAKPSVVQQVVPEVEEIPEEGASSGFYTSLPNQEAAEVLASLQAAGKINSNLMQISQRNNNINNNNKNNNNNDREEETVKGDERKKPMSIYVPDGEGAEVQEDEYDDYSQEQQDDFDDEQAVVKEVEEGFGHKLKPKRS